MNVIISIFKCLKFNNIRIKSQLAKNIFQFWRRLINNNDSVQRFLKNKTFKKSIYIPVSCTKKTCLNTFSHAFVFH